MRLLPISNRRGRLRDGRRRGSYFLELAFTLVPLVALVAGVADFGLALFTRTTLQNAVAAGVRYGVTYKTKPGYGMDDSIRLATQSAAMGLLGATTSPNSNIKVRYYHPSNLSSEVSGAAGNQPLNILEVSVENYQWTWITNLSGVRDNPRSTTPLSIVVYSSDRLGYAPPGTNIPAR